MRVIPGLTISTIVLVSLWVPTSSFPLPDVPSGDTNVQTETSAEVIIARYFEAIGGADAVKGVASRRMSYWVHMLGRDAYLIEKHWTRPDSMRTGRVGATTYTLTEGEHSWRVSPEGRQELPEAVARSMSKLADIDGPLVDPEKKRVTLTYSGVVHHDMTDLHQVTATFADGEQWEFFFDTTTGLLRRMKEPSITLLDGQFKRGPDTYSYYFDYRPVDSLLHPHLWVQATEDGVHVFVVEDIQLDQ